MRVLKEDSRNKHKFEIAKAYCSQKLTDFRCEERRRVRHNIHAYMHNVIIIIIMIVICRALTMRLHAYAPSYIGSMLVYFPSPILTVCIPSQ